VPPDTEYSAAELAHIADVVHQKETTWLRSIWSSQPLWVTIALLILVGVMTLTEPSFGTSTTRPTSPATSRRSASWRSA
jgi:hypothetical protein